jgi:hypothetical protein
MVVSFARLWQPNSQTPQNGSSPPRRSWQRSEAEAKLSERLAPIAAIRADAAAAGADYSQLARASDDDLSKALAKFVAGLEQIRSIHSELKDRLSSLQQKCDTEMRRRRSG